MDNDDDDNEFEETKKTTAAAKEPCQLCNQSEHKYKCPRCLLLTCSLLCSKQHKQLYSCSGVKDHIASMRVKMNDFTVGTMKKDLRFIDDAIALSNTAKKKSLLDPSQGGNAVLKIPKKAKNLRYFLRKKRNIIYRMCPMSGFFTRSHLNTTYFDSQSADQKLVHWTIELIFYRQTS